jgi:hypothetical protein
MERNENALRLVGGAVGHALDLAGSHVDVELDGLAADLAILDEALAPGLEAHGHGGVLEAVRTAEDDRFLHGSECESESV